MERAGVVTEDAAETAVPGPSVVGLGLRVISPASAVVGLVPLPPFQGVAIGFAGRCQARASAPVQTVPGSEVVAMAAIETKELPVEVAAPARLVRETVEEVVVSAAVQERHRRVHVAVKVADRAVT